MPSTKTQAQTLIFKEDKSLGIAMRGQYWNIVQISQISEMLKQFLKMEVQEYMIGLVVFFRNHLLNVF